MFTPHKQSICEAQMLKPDSLRLISSKSQLNSELSSLKVPPKIASENDLSELDLWQIARGAIALSKWWQTFLIVVGSASSIVYPHVPLVGFAAIAGNTLTRKKALVSVTSIWVGNQLYGFIIRQYPRNLESLVWGLVMGLGIVLVTWLVTLQPKFSHKNWQGYLLWLAISVVGGYAIYQGSIILIAQLISGHGFCLGCCFIYCSWMRPNSDRDQSQQANYQKINRILGTTE
jgi:hypothetical protein